MTLAQRELLAAAHAAVAVLAQLNVGGANRVKKALQVAIVRVELEDRAALPSVDAQALVRGQAD